MPVSPVHTVSHPITLHGKPHTLTYNIYASVPTAELQATGIEIVYDIEVILMSGGDTVVDQKRVPCVTSNEKTAQQIVRMLADGLTTPCGVGEVLEDLLVTL